MNKGRLEAFSDGVIAILITVMVLELTIPADASFAALKQVLPVFPPYALSFIFLGIYWNNHHHMLYATQRINGKVLWANHHLLFWLSLVPFATGWVSKTHSAPLPTAVYGIIMMMSAIAYTILLRTIIAQEGPDSKLAKAIGKDSKGYLSLACYIISIPAAFINPWISDILFILVALIWLIPDRRIESRLNH
ncbi:MAG TPA: TMEM175 family protein [Blastocatellia bacterium]|nr:TMEM175 family protein [Blastocatellia bacterium]